VVESKGFVVSNPITQRDLDQAFENLADVARSQEMSRKHAEQKIAEYQAKLKGLETDIQKYHEARQLFIECAKFSREKTVSRVEKNLTAALRAVFQDPSMEFKVEITEKRSILHADFLVCFDVKGKRVEADPLEAKGGSIVDVVTTGLILVFLTTYRPKKRQVLFLDEPGKYLDHDRRMRYGQWLARISHDLKVQLTIITHDEELKAIADKLFELRPGKDGVTVNTKEAA
jgi:DNA repair exonuclease SbcCD ATPase subunit